MSVGVNPPKTPITKGSNGMATATLPNVCKMPGPPAPFVPSPLPNFGKSGEKPDGYTSNVKVEGKSVAIKGASFGSMGDMASKGTGGGLVSASTHGICKFIGPGSMDVKFEGGNVQQLSDPMTNNGAGSGSPANAATMMGAVQEPASKDGSCLHENLRREKPLGVETRSTQELVQELDAEADRLDALAQIKQSVAMAANGVERKKLLESAMDTKSGAADKRWEAKVAQDTEAKEVSVKIICADCGSLQGEYDVITKKGTHKECKRSGKAVSPRQFWKEVNFAKMPGIAPPNSVVHLAVPGDGVQRKKALDSFTRPGGKKMTNKGAGYQRVIQEH